MDCPGLELEVEPLVHLELGVVDIPEMLSGQFSEKHKNNIDDLFQFIYIQDEDQDQETTTSNK